MNALTSLNYTSPIDTSVEKMYVLQIQVNDESINQITSTEFKLVVGCPSSAADLLTINFGSSFVSAVQLSLLQTSLQAFVLKFDSSTHGDFKNCDLKSRALNVVSFEDMYGTDTSQPTFSTTTSLAQCTPTNCGQYKISSTSDVLKITVNLDLEFGGTQFPSVKTIRTPDITVEVVCVSGITTITPSTISQPQL